MVTNQHSRALARIRTGRRWLVALVVAAAVVLSAPGALAAAQTRIGLNGGRPSEWPFLSSVLASQGLTQEGWLAFASRVGENWLPNTDSVPLNYPGQLGLVSGPNALTADQSTAEGQRLLHALILSELENGPVAVTGLSEGTLVIDKELEYLRTLSEADAPSRKALTFYVFGDMLRGLGQTYLPGVTIPFIGQTFGPVPETKYDTVVVNEEWDGWANPPDRPWNLLADLNAVMGAVYTVNGSNDHSQTSLDSLADAVKVSEITNSLGGTTTTYVVPRTQLPITRPLLQLGVPRWVVDEIDKLLMPVIRTGYSNMTPYLGPYVDHGQLVFTPPTTTPNTTTTTTTSTLDEASSEPVGTPDPDVAADHQQSRSAAADATKTTSAPTTVATTDEVEKPTTTTGSAVAEPSPHQQPDGDTEDQPTGTKTPEDTGTPPKADPEPKTPPSRPTQVREPAQADRTSTTAGGATGSTTSDTGSEKGTVKGPDKGPDKSPDKSSDEDASSSHSASAA